MCAALDEEKVTVVGAGLAGSLMSLLLAKRGLAVRVLEKRSDMRKGSWGRGDASAEKDSDNNDKQDDFQKGLSRFKDSAKRSINLALSHRGICALKEAGIFQKVERLLIPMNGRVIHDIQGNITIQPYGKDHQAIFSVSRQTLNELLLDELDKLENVELMFETGVKRVYPDGSILIEKEGNPVKLFSKFVIGADGAFSGVRKSMMHFCRMDYRQNYLDCGYKELTIPPINNEFGLSNPEGLHIWPRHNFMLIALPNPDKTFTCTLFAPFDGPDGLDTFRTSLEVERFFEKNFKDVVPVIPHLAQQFFESPSSPLLTVKCKPWHHRDKVLILGDAAHALVPFYGQGMNSAFEDCLLFAEIFDSFKGDPGLTIRTFSEMRQPSGYALADLSLANYKEMSSDTASSFFLWKKKIEAKLHEKFPQLWIPLYTMVAFTRIPYQQAVSISKRQDLAFYAGLAVVGFFCVLLLLLFIYLFI